MKKCGTVRSGFQTKVELEVELEEVRLECVVVVGMEKARMKNVVSVLIDVHSSHHAYVSEAWRLAVRSILDFRDLL